MFQRRSDRQMGISHNWINVMSRSSFRRDYIARGLEIQDMENRKKQNRSETI